ncbi:MAG: hypothetical protein ABUM51_02350 [Bacteroidota bacterium]
MRYIYTFLIGSLLTFEAAAQRTSAQLLDSVKTENNNQNLYTFRKYSFSLAVSPYTNITHGGGNYLFGATEVMFSNRIKWLNFARNASVEANMGISFEPYQGMKLNLGLDYLVLPKSHRTNLYAGFQFSQGLKQLTTIDNSTSITVGYHSYILPFIGFIWWPWKENNLYTAQNRVNDAYLHPQIAQLFYIKLQVGYSFLLNSHVSVDTTGNFTDTHLYQVIRNNSANTFTFRICIGLNIPTYDKEVRNKYRKTLHTLQQMQL